MSFRLPANLIDKYLPFILRIILSGIFIYAAVGKILYPADFSEQIANYQLMPVMLTNLVSLTLHRKFLLIALALA